MKLGRFPLFVVFLLVVGSTSAEVYTWTDDTGTVHFTDRRPPGNAAKTISPGPTSIVPMNRNLTAGEAITDTVGSSAPVRGHAQKSRDEQRARCKKYRQQLAGIQSQLRAGYSNAKGNRLRARRRQLNARLSRECILG